MDTKMYAPQAILFKALMHPARLAILDLLREGEECVCHLEAFSGYRQAYISQQLSVLRDAGLVKDRRDGWNIFYSVIRPEIYDILDMADRMQAGMQRSRQVRGNVHACQCPKCNPAEEKEALQSQSF